MSTQPLAADDRRVLVVPGQSLRRAGGGLGFGHGDGGRQHRDNDDNDNDDYDETGLDGIDDGGMVTTTNATTEAVDDLYFDNNVITTSAQTACLRSISRTTSALSLKFMSAKSGQHRSDLLGVVG